MAYRNKTFVSFTSEDIRYYRLMCAWNASENIEFDFHDAHDLNTALDTSSPDTIRRRRRDRLANTKQVVMLIGDGTRTKAARPSSFIHYEAEVIAGLDIPVILANLDQNRGLDVTKIPEAIVPLCTISVSFQARIIQYALDSFPVQYAGHDRNLDGTWQSRLIYPASVYGNIGL